MDEFKSVWRDFHLSTAMLVHMNTARSFNKTRVLSNHVILVYPEFRTRKIMPVSCHNILDEIPDDTLIGNVVCLGLWTCNMLHVIYDPFKLSDDCWPRQRFCSVNSRNGPGCSFSLRLFGNEIGRWNWRFQKDDKAWRNEHSLQCQNKRGTNALLAKRESINIRLITNYQNSKELQNNIQYAIYSKLYSLHWSG